MRKDDINRPERPSATEYRRAANVRSGATTPDRRDRGTVRAPQPFWRAPQHRAHRDANPDRPMDPSHAPRHQPAQRGGGLNRSPWKMPAQTRAPAKSIGVRPDGDQNPVLPPPR